MVLKLFVDPSANLSGTLLLSANNAESIGLPSGGKVSVSDETTGQSTTCDMNVDPDILDFSVKIAIDVMEAINFNGLEISINAAGAAPTAPKKLQLHRLSPLQHRLLQLVNVYPLQQLILQNLQLRHRNLPLQDLLPQSEVLQEYLMLLLLQCQRFQNQLLHYLQNLHRVYRLLMGVIWLLE